MVLGHVAGDSALDLSAKLLLDGAHTTEWTCVHYVAKLSSLVTEIDIVLVQKTGSRVIIEHLVSSWHPLLLLSTLCLMEDWLGIATQAEIVGGGRDA